MKSKRNINVTDIIREYAVNISPDGNNIFRGCNILVGIGDPKELSKFEIVLSR